MKKYCVAEEIIEGKLSGCYSVRLNTDVNPCRFAVWDSFDSFKEADNAIRYWRAINEGKQLPHEG